MRADGAGNPDPAVDIDWKSDTEALADGLDLDHHLARRRLAIVVAG